MGCSVAEHSVIRDVFARLSADVADYYERVLMERRTLKLERTRVEGQSWIVLSYKLAIFQIQGKPKGRAVRERYRR